MKFKENIKNLNKKKNKESRTLKGKFLQTQLKHNVSFGRLSYWFEEKYTSLG